MAAGLAALLMAGCTSSSQRFVAPVSSTRSTTTPTSIPPTMTSILGATATTTTTPLAVTVPPTSTEAATSVGTVVPAVPGPGVAVGDSVLEGVRLYAPD